MKKRFAALAVTCACLAPVVAQATAVELTWSRQWTTSHEAKTGSASTTAEIIARGESNNRLWVVGTEGIDILDAATGNRVETIEPLVSWCCSPIGWGSRKRYGSALADRACRNCCNAHCRCNRNACRRI